MTEEQIWDVIENDAPRRWTVFIDGTFFARETSTAARIVEDARQWLVEALVWEMSYGPRKARVFARCEATDECIAGVVEAVVTPESGTSTAA